MLKLALLLALVASPLGAQQTLIDEGFTAFYNLEYDQAIAIFEKAIAQNPGAARPAQSPGADADLPRDVPQWSAGKRTGLGQQFLSAPSQAESHAGNREAHSGRDRQSHGARRGAAQAESQRHRRRMYASGIAYGLRSNYFWVVKKAWHDSLKDATAARKLHNRISELEPTNVDARLVQGLHDYIVGSLPWGYKMLGFVIGIHGDKEKGIRTVQDVARNGKIKSGGCGDPALRTVPAREPEQTRRPAGAGPDPPLSAQLPAAHGTGPDVQPGGRWRARSAGAWRKWRG